MATTTPNFGWAVPTSSDLVKNGAVAIETLGDAIDASLVDLKGGTTGQVLSKTSGTDMDFTWVAQDDSNAIQNSIVDAKGDLITASADDTPARLAAGANGETLVADSSTATGLKWAKSPNFVGVSLFNSTATQSIPNSTFTALTFDSEFFDSDSFHSTSTNTSRITIPAGLGGKYQVNINSIFDLSAAGIRQITLYKNGLNFFSSGEVAGSGTVYVGAAGGFVMDLSASDYIEVFVYQTSGGNLQVYKRSQDAPFSVTYLGA